MMQPKPAVVLFCHVRFALYFIAVLGLTPSSLASGRIFSPAAVRSLISVRSLNGSGEPRLAMCYISSVDRRCGSSAESFIETKWCVSSIPLGLHGKTRFMVVVAVRAK